MSETWLPIIPEDGNVGGVELIPNFCAGLNGKQYPRIVLCAWGILDAQHFGVPQRRDRVFVVANLGDGNDSAAVLFDRHCLSGHPAPCREEGARIASSLTRGADSSGKGGYAGRRREDDTNIVVNCLDAHMGMGGPDDNAAQGNHLIGVNNFGVQDVATALSTSNQRLDGDTETFVVAIQEDNQNGVTIRRTTGSLRSDAPGTQPCGTLLGVTPIDMRQASRGATMTNNRSGSETGGVTFVMQPIPILEVGKGSSSRGDGPNGCGIGKSEDPMFTLQAGAQHAVAIAFDAAQITSNVSRVRAEDGLPASTIFATSRMHVATNDVPLMSVRRLTPQECERLQGFPDGHTKVEFRGKLAADGPRYRAIGNSMCVDVLEWIGRRIQQVEDASA